MDENEFADRIEKIRSSLYRTAYLCLGSEMSALDALDEAVYMALISLKKLRRPENFDTWITRILINELGSRKLEISVDSLPEQSAEQFDALSLGDAVLRLPKDLKEPIILRYFAGLTTEETARVLKLKQGSSATCLRRALKLLRLEFTEEEKMNRNNEYNELLLKLENTPLKLDYTLERARARKAARDKRNCVKKAVYIPLCTIAAVFVIFAALVNFSAPFAEACSKIPVLNKLADAVYLPPSLRHAVENGYMQEIGLACTKNGVTARIEYVVADQKQLTNAPAGLSAARTSCRAGLMLLR